MKQRLTHNDLVFLQKKFVGKHVMLTLPDGSKVGGFCHWLNYHKYFENWDLCIGLGASVFSRIDYEKLEVYTPSMLGHGRK